MEVNELNIQTWIFLLLDWYQLRSHFRSRLVYYTVRSTRYISFISSYCRYWVAVSHRRLPERKNQDPANKRSPRTSGTTHFRNRCFVTGTSATLIIQYLARMFSSDNEKVLKTRTMCKVCSYWALRRVQKFVLGAHSTLLTKLFLKPAPSTIHSTMGWPDGSFHYRIIMCEAY